MPVLDPTALLAVSHARLLIVALGGEGLCLQGEIFNDGDDYTRTAGNVPERWAVREPVSTDRKQASDTQTLIALNSSSGSAVSRSLLSGTPVMLAQGGLGTRSAGTQPPVCTHVLLKWCMLPFVSGDDAFVPGVIAPWRKSLLKQCLAGRTFLEVRSADLTCLVGIVPLLQKSGFSMAERKLGSCLNSPPRMVQAGGIQGFFGVTLPACL